MEFGKKRNKKKYLSQKQFHYVVCAYIRQADQPELIDLHVLLLQELEKFRLFPLEEKK